MCAQTSKHTRALIIRANLFPMSIVLMLLRIIYFSGEILLSYAYYMVTQTLRFMRIHARLHHTKFIILKEATKYGLLHILLKFPRNNNLPCAYETIPWMEKKTEGQRCDL